MGLLRLEHEGKPCGEFALEQERMAIGRHPSCAIHISDPAVSGRHALIINVMEDSFLQDLDSTNGTYVNGRLVRKRVLQDGDVIGVGTHLLTYEKGRQGAADDFDKTMVIRPGMPAWNTASREHVHAIRTAEGNVARVTADGGEAPATGELEVLSGPARGRRLELNKAMITLGRPGVQVAVISRRASGYFITSVRGASGGGFPRVNGVETGPVGQRLDDGDEIELAGVRMRFTGGA